MIRFSSIVTVSDPSQVAAARRAAVRCAESIRAAETTAGHAALAATELATNLVKHANGGSILFGVDDGTHRSIGMAAIDKGRGIASVGTAMQDGFSTAGSPGTGLGAISRSAAQLDIYSMPDKGTAVLCRVQDENGARRPPSVPVREHFAVAGVCLPIATEEQSGDAWELFGGGNVITIVIADGLGHGGGAATASIAALRAARENPDTTLEQMIRNMHDALRATRGAAVGIARIDAAARRLDFAGVGNIAGTIVSDDATRKVVSHNGIVGHEMRKVQSFSYPWPESSILIMHSDGVGGGWNAANYPGLLSRDAALIAGVVYRDFCRAHDDSTIVVAKAC